jgi:hypothetical protein
MKSDDRWIWTLQGLLCALTMVALAVDLGGCPRPPPGPGTPPSAPAVCSGNLIAECAPQVLPLVGECLAATSDVVACVLGITRLVGCATYEILACVVRHEGSAASAAYQANHEDTRDHWRAQRAREFIERTGAKFNEGGGGP